MVARTSAVLIVLALAGGSLPAAANSPSSPDAAFENYKAAERALYDALSHDPSPRMQVLAGRIYLSDSDEETPSVLRPKRQDVISRATQLAPDDAFVQWTAAADGSYSNSQCGPSDWPEIEVANLVRLEPDNAAAWQFAVALERAKGSQAGIDETLSRMAAASRADDHSGESVAAWTRAYLAHPESASPMATIWGEGEVTPQAKALSSALVQTGVRSSPAMSALEEVCKPDASTERTWQRAAWCADAATLFAEKGTSVALRKQGLKLLEIVGDRSAPVAELQRSHDWLDAHSANPVSYSHAMGDTPANVLADWRDGANEIEATQRRLARTGEPSMPPPGWSAVAERDSVHKDDDEDAALATADALRDYFKAVVADLHASKDVREQALSAASTQVMGVFATASDPKSATGTDVAAEKAALGVLAVANPDNRFVQWMAARSDSQAAASAIENLQRTESDNAAAWMLGLAPALDETHTLALLQHIATSARYDEHEAELLKVWLATLQRQPLPAALAEQLLPMMGKAADPSSDVSAQLAVMMTSMTLAVASIPPKLAQACSASSTRSADYQQACAASARRLLASGSTLATHIGEQILRSSNTLDASDSTRARQIAWWRQVMVESMSSMNGDAMRAITDDFIASGSEIDAMRKFAESQGKGEPPADWLSPADKAAAKKQKAK